MLKGVIFDFNGTLFFDSNYHFEVFKQLKKEITGQDLTLEEMEKEYSGKPNTEIFKKMSNNTFSLEKCEYYSQRKEAMYRELVRKNDSHLCHGAIPLFDYLKEKNIPFTIASASIKENIDFFVEYFHLEQWFDVEQIVYDDGSYADKTMMFLEAKRRLQIQDHLLIFEDSLSGIQCATKVGASLIVIERDNLKDCYADYPILQVVKDLSESLETVKELCEMNH